MTAPLLALSLSNTLLKVGALAAFAGLVGIAVLSLLVFSQARELKRLREWAGRAPERAAELEQRVSMDAAARVQRVVQPRAGGGPIPRATPVVARAATGAGPATRVASGAAPAEGLAPSTVAASGGAPVPVAGQSGLPLPGQPAPGQSAPVSAEQPAAAPLPGQPAFVPTPQPAPVAAGQQVTGASQQGPGTSSVAGETQGSGAMPQSAMGSGATVEPAVLGASLPPAPAGGVGAAPATQDTQLHGEATSGLAPAAGASAEQAAKAATGLTETESAPVGGIPTPATVAARATTPATRPPAPAPAAPARSATPPPPRSARPAAPESPRAGTAQGARGVPNLPPGGGVGARAGRAQGPPFLQEERSPGRTTALIVGGVVFGVAVLVGVLLSLGGSTHKGQATSAVSHSVATGGHAPSHHAHATVVVASPAETHVVVLNGTETNGLAHRLAANLQQSGYTQSTALDAHPAGRSTSVVEYTGGHHTEALHVAQTLGITQVSPLEGAIVPLVGSATVVVVAGADQAALAGGEAAGGAAQ